MEMPPPATAALERRKAVGWAARDTSGVLSPFMFTRRANGEWDITIRILYCGICHSDIYYAKNAYGFSNYPVVPGHEIIGEVIEVGSKVQKFKPRDNAGVGSYVRSCRSCDQCNQHLESYCPKIVYTVSGTDFADGISATTHGGFSDKIVVDEWYAVRVPDGLPLASAAPLLCAGITVYSPMQYYGLNKAGLHVGVVGLGGLGHMAVRFAKATGMKVTVVSTSPAKAKDAMELLGADAFLLSHNQQHIKDAVGSMDGIIDTVAGAHPLAPLISLLKPHGKLVMVGAAESIEVPLVPLLHGRKLIGGSFTGGIKETQEMMDFAVEHNVTPQVEVIAMDYVNTAFERLARGDVGYRFVIDVANTLQT